MGWNKLFLWQTIDSDMQMTHPSRILGMLARLWADFRLALMTIFTFFFNSLFYNSCFIIPHPTHGSEVLFYFKN